MSMVCWVNGTAADTLPILDRGLHYGDGLFETLAVKQGHIGLLEQHLERLEDGCKRLGLPMPEQGTLRMELTAAAEGQERAVLKLMVTRGAAGRGYRPPAQAQVNRILLRYPWPDYPASWADTGVRLRVCDMRLSEQPRLAGLKHLNRLEQVMARGEWSETDDYQEGLMLDPAGRVIEGTMSNVFVSPREGLLLTPDLSRCGVAGVMRRHILEKAKAEGIQTQVADLPLAVVIRHPEVFLCNSLMGVWPVAELYGRSYEVGPMTRLAQTWAAAA